jgi:hypothetical protein
MCPDLHEIVEGEEGGGDVEGEPSEASLPRTGGGGSGMADRVAKLEAEVAALRAALVKLAGEVGAGNPFETNEGSEAAAGEGGQAS